MEYKEQLKSPMWQKKRLEIMERDKFTCQCCGDTESQLQVHHTRYEFGKKVWEYDNETLITFCEDCHSDATDFKKIIKSTIDSQFIYTDSLNELEGIMSILCILDPYELNKIKKALSNKYIKKNGL